MTADVPAALRLLTVLDRRDPAYSSVFSETLEIEGASVATLGHFLGSETLSATGYHAARLDELQFDLGEGPCWDAMNHGRPVLAPGIHAMPTSPWPALLSLLPGSIDGLFAFPLALGPLKIGAVDLYTTSGGQLGDERTAAAEAMAAVVSRQVLRSALAEVRDEYRDDSLDRHSRRAVHQATGIVFAQLSIQIDDARLILEGHAFATGRPLMEVADDVVAGRLSFRLDGATMRDDDER